MENIKVEVQISQVEFSVKQLIESISEDIYIDDSLNLWEILGRLSLDQFVLLKSNVYFANLISSIRVSMINNISIVDFPKSKDVEKSNLHVLEEIEIDDKNIQVLEEDNHFINNKQLPSLYTTLDNLDLPDQFLKLVKRLRGINRSAPTFNLGETLGDLINIPIDEVASLPGVGVTYIETFKELKSLFEVAPLADFLDNDLELKLVDTSNMRLSLVGVESKFIKALEKYARSIGVQDLGGHIDEILNLNRSDLLKIPGFGVGVVNKLIEFKYVIQEEIKLIGSSELNYERLESVLIVPKVLEKIEIERIGEILLEDIDAYFDKISENDINIIQRRWGFIDSKQTLEEIAIDFNVTRERIRQKEAKINSKFLRHLRVSSPNLWRFIKPELSSDIKLKFKGVYSCFSLEKDFYDFLSLICNQDKIYEYIYPEIDKAILNNYFAENGAPINFDDARDYILSLKLQGVDSVDNAIRYLAQLGEIFINHNNIWPRKLRKAEATACVLNNHEKGLPWLDIARLVNSNGYSRTNIYEDRVDIEAFKSPDYIFLAGKGIYKHTRFIDFDSISLDEIFIALMEYAQSISREVFHLSECYNFSNYLKKHDYFVIRYFVKNFGEDYGFYFNGRSQADSVGLEKGFKNITQKDVIIEAMKNSSKPLTKPEVANLIKSKSLDHASFYLDSMINEGRVVQVERMLYTTPESAYSSIDLNQYLNAIGELLLDYSIPIEPSIFKEKLNRRFEQSYSKFFYASIARLNFDKHGWFRKQNLYSINTIPFDSLKDAMDNICTANASTNENIIALEKHIAISRETANRAILNWRQSLANLNR